MAADAESGMPTPTALLEVEGRSVSGTRRSRWLWAAAVALGLVGLGAAGGFALGRRQGPSPALLSERVAANSTGAPLTVVTYNLYWWCVSDEYGNCPQNKGGAGFSKLYSTIERTGPFDLIGFQECDNVAQVVNGAGLGATFAYYLPPAGNDAGMAWSTARFDEIEGPGVDYVSSDQYGKRNINWVRLRDKTTGKNVLFCNTHGPLNQCGGGPGKNVAAKYMQSINAHRKPGDAVVFTGDFNCGSGTDTVKSLVASLADAGVDTSYGGADHILVSGLDTVSYVAANGGPSDHQILKATLQEPGAGPAPGPAPAPGPSPGPTPSGCPADPTKDNHGCCTSCTYNHFCPTNHGCYATGQAGCAGGYCPGR